MSDDSMKDIFEKSKIVITSEEHQKLTERAEKRKSWLKDHHVKTRIIVRIEKARIDEIENAWNVINKFQKENPFQSKVYAGEVRIKQDDPFPDGVQCFTLDVPYYSGFGILGRILIQRINAIQANIEIKTMGDLIPMIDQEKALNLYFDACSYLTDIARYLKRLYSDQETKITENHDPDYFAGRPKFIGYDVAYKKMMDDGLTREEAFSFWRKCYPHEYKSSNSPLLAFFAAMRRRSKSTKR